MFSRDAVVAMRKNRHAAEIVEADVANDEQAGIALLRLHRLCRQHGERTGKYAWPIGQLLDRLLDTLGCMGLDWNRAVQEIRDRANRNPGGLRNIGDRRASLLHSIPIY